MPVVEMNAAKRYVIRLDNGELYSRAGRVQSFNTKRFAEFVARRIER